MRELSLLNMWQVRAKVVHGQMTGQHRYALVGGLVVLPTASLHGLAIVVEGDRITGVAEERTVDPSVPRVDVGGRVIAPGLIDIHVHGALGHSFMEPTPTAYATICRAHLAGGVTSLVATLASAAIETLVRCLDFAGGWMAHPHDGAQVVGVHLEGPYLSPVQRGAHNPIHLRTPDDESVTVLLEYSDVLTMMTYAPELPGALSLTETLVRRGIVPAAGHSAAMDTEVRAAISHGLRHVTHLWSGQSTTIRQGPWRKPGLLEAALVFEELTVDMIADGRHLPPTLMRLARKCIAPERLSVISDATEGAGLPEGTSLSFGGLETEIRDGVMMLRDHTGFAGSTTILNRMIPVLLADAGMSLSEAITAVTLAPARVIGLDGRKGSIEAGKDADLVIFDPDFTPWRTILAGRWVDHPERPPGSPSGDTAS